MEANGREVMRFRHSVSVPALPGLIARGRHWLFLAT